MNNEEIDYWLRLFSNHNQSFMSKDGKKITLFKVFQELKELQYLLKIKNDYINELEQENQKYKEVIDKAIEELKKGLHELDTRRREEVYVEEYLEESIEILEEVNK